MATERRSEDSRGKGRRSPIRDNRPEPDDARASLLASADRLFYSRGIGTVGVAAVAEEAGVTKRTLYYHFKSKDDLIAEYLKARDQTTLSALRNIVSDKGPLPGDRIVAVFEFIEQWSASPGYHGCPFNNAVGERGLGARVTAIARRHKATVESWFADRAAEGGARKPADLGAELLVLLDGALNGAATFGSSDLARAARNVAEALLEAAGVAQSRIPKARAKGRRI